MSSVSVVPTPSGCWPTRSRHSTCSPRPTSPIPTALSTPTTIPRSWSPRTSPTHPPTRSAGRRRTASEAQAPGEVVLVFHVTDRDLLDGEGVARSPKLGPVLVGRLRSWLLCAGKVTITPVVDLDPDAHPPVDAHDPPARMAAAVRLRDQTCVYPHCGRASASCDLDHITEYVDPDEGGPPGQTVPAKPSHRCADGTTAPRPSASSPTEGSPTAPTDGPSPPATQVNTDPPRPRPRP